MVRRGGRVTLPDGSEITWSVADGRRGRRWRTATTRDGRLQASLLLEVGADGRPARLELSTAAGLLTLHPEAGESLHGNAVTPGGVRHLSFDWSEDHGLEIDANRVPTAVTAGRLASTTPAGEGRAVPVVVIRDDLVVRTAGRRFEQVGGPGSWQVTGDGQTTLLALDADGLPVWPQPAEDWPLELDEDG